MLTVNEKQNQRNPHAAARSVLEMLSLGSSLLCVERVERSDTRAFAVDLTEGLHGELRATDLLSISVIKTIWLSLKLSCVRTMVGASMGPWGSLSCLQSPVWSLPAFQVGTLSVLTCSYSGLSLLASVGLHLGEAPYKLLG